MRELTVSDIAEGLHSIISHYLITNTAFNIDTTNDMEELYYSHYLDVATILIKIADCIYITIPIGLAIIPKIQHQLKVATHLTYINNVKLFNGNEEIDWWSGSIIYMTDIELSSLLLEQLNTKEF